jgi:hypothetical protein
MGLTAARRISGNPRKVVFLRRVTARDSRVIKCLMSKWWLCGCGGYISFEQSLLSLNDTWSISLSITENSLSSWVAKFRAMCHANFYTTERRTKSCNTHAASLSPLGSEFGLKNSVLRTPLFKLLRTMKWIIGRAGRISPTARQISSQTLTLLQLKVSIVHHEPQFERLDCGPFCMWNSWSRRPISKSWNRVHMLMFAHRLQFGLFSLKTTQRSRVST